MKRSISSYIIYSIIFILAIATLLTIYRVQTTYTCLNNIQEIKNLITSSVLSLNTSYSNIEITLEIPSSYEYMIYSKNGEIYIKDLRCNIEDKLDINVTLVGPIISKEKIYLIKNFSTIYLSPYEIEINPSTKTDIFTNITPIVSQSQESNNSNKIYFIYIRSEKQGGTTISDSDLEYYAKVFTEATKKIYTTSFKDVPYFNDSSLYDYRVIYDFLPVSYDDYGSNYFFESFSIARKVCQDINKDNPIAVIFVILINDSSVEYAGISELALYQIRNMPLLASFSSCNAKILVVVEANLAYYSLSTKASEVGSSFVVAHEVGHAIGNLADQYVNGCGAEYAFFTSDDLGINFFEELEKYGLKCNWLRSSLDAKPYEGVINLLNYYSPELSKLFDINYLENEVCYGDRVILIRTNDIWHSIIIINITNPNHGPEINLATECNAIIVSSSGDYTIENCLSFFQKSGISVFDAYEYMLNYCISNRDITGSSRDIMGNVNVGYFSETSIEAFKNNLCEIWGIC